MYHKAKNTKENKNIKLVTYYLSDDTSLDLKKRPETNKDKQSAMDFVLGSVVQLTVPVTSAN